MTIEEIAEIAHEVNRAYCNVMGDNSHSSWDVAPEWQKQSFINGVKFYIENPNSTPSNVHKNWLDEKIKNGWKFGLLKNTEKKEHPCCVEYEQLPTAQKIKDSLFKAIIDILK